MTRAYSGADSQAMWGVEATFGTVAASVTKVFGPSLAIESVSMERGATLGGGIGSRTAGSVRRGVFAGAVSVSFNVSPGHTDWLALVFPDTTTANTWKEGSDVGSITIRHSFGGKVQDFLGCVCTGMSLDADVDTPTVKATLEFAYAKEPGLTTGSALKPTYSGESATFADATLNIGGWSSCPTRSVSISTTTGMELLHGISDYEACAYAEGRYEHGISLRHVATTEQQLFSAYRASAGSAMLVLTVGSDTLTFSLTDALANSYSYSVSDADPIEESIEMVSRSMTVTKGTG